MPPFLLLPFHCLLFFFLKDACVALCASSLRRLKSIVMHIDAKLYESLKCLGKTNWRAICKDLLGVEVTEKITVHEGETFETVFSCL